MSTDANETGAGIAPQLWQAYRATASTENRDRLVEHYWPVALSIARAEAAGTTPAVDRDLVTSAAGEALLKAVESFAAGEGQSFTNWLRLCVARLLRKHIGQDRRQRAQLQTARPRRRSRPASQLNELFAELMQGQGIEDCVLAYLHWLQRRPLPETAEILRLGLRTAERRLHRLREHIRQHHAAADFFADLPP